MREGRREREVTAPHTDLEAVKEARFETREEFLSTVIRVVQHSFAAGSEDAVKGGLQVSDDPNAFTFERGQERERERHTHTHRQTAAWPSGEWMSHRIGLSKRV